MYQLIALFKQPADPEAFDRAYAETHLPLAKKIPGLVSLQISKILPGRDGNSPYYQMAVLNFAGKDEFKTAMKSAENAAAGQNLMQIAPGGVDFFTAERVELP